MLARRLIVAAGAGPRPEAGAVAGLVTWGVLALLALGLALSLFPARRHAPDPHSARENSR